MDLTEKKEFIRKVIREEREALMKLAKELPEDWDGYELFMLIADRFGHGVRRDDRRRVGGYKTVVNKKNLLRTVQ